MLSGFGFNSYSDLNEIYNNKKKINLVNVNVKALNCFVAYLYISIYVQQIIFWGTINWNIQINQFQLQVDSSTSKLIIVQFKTCTKSR